MSNDVIWIVTDETAEEPKRGARDGGALRNPYEDEPDGTRPAIDRRGKPVTAEKLKKEMSEFVQVMGQVLNEAKASAKEVGGMELDEIELSVEVNGEGQVSLFGMGGKVGGKGAMKLKFKAVKPQPT
jgi:hypothetical protein